MELGLELGVTGAPSLASSVQNSMHRLLDVTPQLGWSHQVPARGGIVMRASDERVRQGRIGSLHSTVGASWKVVAGNVRNALTTGVSARLAHGTRVVHTPMGPTGGTRYGAWLQLNVAHDIVGSDLFIDGVPHGATSYAERYWWVGEASVSAGIQHRLGSVEVRHVARTPEYRAQQTSHAFGSIRITLHRWPARRGDSPIVAMW